MNTTRQTILTSLGERLRLSNMDDRFVMTTMEIHTLNSFIKDDLYTNTDCLNDKIKQQIDNIWDRIAILLNYNTWNSSFNNTNQITYREYFKEFIKILEDSIIIKVYLNEPPEELEGVRETVQMLNEAVAL